MLGRIGMAEVDISKLYTVIEKVATGEEINLDEIFKAIVDTNSLSLQLISRCLSNSEDKIYSDICGESFRLIEEAVDAILKHLIARFLEGGVKLEKDLISRLCISIANIVEAIKRISLNTIIVQEERVLCRVVKTIEISNRVIAKGFITLLPVELAVVLTALGYVEPVYVWM